MSDASRNGSAKAAQGARLSRRGFLVAGGLCAVGAGVAGTAVWTSFRDSRAAWVEDVIRRNLPGVTIDEASLQTFVSEMVSHDWLQPQMHRLSVFAQQTVPWVTARIPKARDGLEKLERRVLTEFLIGSNFFRVSDPKQETISYYGQATACPNPFVTFT